MNSRRRQCGLAARGAALKPFLDSLYKTYHQPAMIGPDPLGVVRECGDATDMEVAALFAALLAYGNVRQINRDVRNLFARMDNRPGWFVRKCAWHDAEAKLAGFKHRFTDAEDILCLSWLLRQALRNGSLEDFFLQGHSPDEPDLVNAASRFLDNLFSLDFEPHFDRDRMLAKSSFKHLLPRADRGSACKRIHLFLRWMIRPADGLDLGLWQRISPAKLLIPVDTHVLRIAGNVGILKSRTGSLKAAREITTALRAACPEDPVRYDFTLCHMGITKACPRKSEIDLCNKCDLAPICLKRRKLARSAQQ